MSVPGGAETFDCVPEKAGFRPARPAPGHVLPCEVGSALSLNECSSVRMRRRGFPTERASGLLRSLSIIQPPKSPQPTAWAPQGWGLEL